MTSSSIPQFIEKQANPSSIAHRGLIFSVGVNDARYIVSPYIDGKQTSCPFYVVWRLMIMRCYSEKYTITHPTYVNCVVCDEWLVFSTFRKWMEKQDWEGNELDKDLLILGNKIYSPETCLFVSSTINRVVRSSESIRGAHPQGVSYHKIRKMFVSSCRVDGVLAYLGQFSTAEEAKLVYDKFKAKEIRRLASLQSNTELKEALHRYADTYIRRVKRRA